MMFRSSTFILIAILLLATLLRFYRLDAQSLWSDEGASVAQAVRDIPTSVQNAAGDIHPPLYYILLHFWVIPFGTNEIGVRSFSAVLGVALVGVCYLLGRKLWDECTGLIAALLAAINPFQIYYAQEARMYMLLALLGALTVYATIRGLDNSQLPRKRPNSQIRDRKQRWYGVYLIAAVMGLYTHYLFPIVLVVCNLLFVIAVLRTSQKHRSGTWIVLQLATMAAFLPWLPTALRQITTWPAGPQTFSAADAPLVILRVLSEGLSAPNDDMVWLALFGLLVLIGMARNADQRTQDDQQAYLPYSSSLVPVLYLLAPIAVMFALSLFKDAFLKFLLVASPPFILLSAHGVSTITHYASRITHHVLRFTFHPSTSLRTSASRFTFHPSTGSGQAASRFTLPLLLLVLILPSALSLQNYYCDPRFARDDYRSIAQTISALAKADDAIILNAPGQQEIFNFYYHGNLAVYPLPQRRPLDVTQIEDELTAISARHPRVFVVLWATDESDPQGVIESWLDRHAFKASDHWYGNVRLAMYASARAGSSIQHPLQIKWGEQITLLGYTMDQNTIKAGEVLALTLFWRTDRGIGTRYKIFVHLLDPRGFVIAQRDAEPLAGLRPTNSWQAGESIRDAYGLFVPFGTPPLTYQIEIGLYDLDSGQRLKNSSADDRLLLDPIQVRPVPQTPPLAAFGMQTVNIASSDAVNLVGYRVDKLGAEGRRDVTLHPGDAIHLALFWRKAQDTASDGSYRWQLGTLAKQTTPTDGLYPLAQWSVGEIVRDDQIISLPADWRAGRYALEIDGKKIAEVEVR